MNGEGVAEIMQARLVARSCFPAHPGRPSQMNERFADGSGGQRRAVAVYEERRFARSGSAGRLTLIGVFLHRPGELRPEGHEAGLVELRLPYGEQRGLQVDIGQREVERLPAAQAGAVQHEEQRPEGVRLQLVDPFPVGLRGVEQLINDNYFCRSPWWRWAGRGSTRGACDTARFLTEDGLVTDAQVRRLREKRMAGKTLAAAAAAAGMSERAARKWQSGALPSTAKAPRTWRTREDPFADVWQSEVVPQLVADTDGRLQVLTLFKALCRRHPGRFQPGQLRTLQRRVRDWRVEYGPDSEVYFEQVAVPGREAAFDFTDASDLGVTLGGVPFPHLLFEWVLSYSRWTYVGLALSETFEALVAGLQDALWTRGGGPAVLRHDNLSARRTS